MVQNVFVDVYNDGAVARLRAVRGPSDELRFRIAALGGYTSSSGLSPSAEARVAPVRDAWAGYVAAADAYGLLRGEHGANLLGRLRDPAYENFRSAMAECEAAWYLGTKLGFAVSPWPPGRPGRALDLLVTHGSAELHVEVKSPYSPPVRGVAFGGDIGLLQGALEEANTQFAPTTTNALVLVPILTSRLFDDRDELVEAFFGRPVVTWSVDTRTGQSVGPTRDGFEQNGHFLSRSFSSGKPLKPSGEPRFTRTSVVLTIEHGYVADSTSHDVLVVHNPNAPLRAAEHLWGDLPQLVPRGEYMLWTDGWSGSQ